MASKPSTEETLEELVESARREVVADWLDVAEIARVMATPPATVAEMRLAGRLHAVWMASEERWLFPLWQLDARGTPIAQVAKVLELLRSPEGFGIEMPSAGWSETEWFYSCHALLDANRPVDLFLSDPTRVLVAAQEEFS